MELVTNIVPMTVGQFLAEQLELLGLDKTSDTYKDVLAIGTEIPTDFATKYKAANVIPLEAAKNNPTIKAHFFKSALDPIDQDILRAFDEHGFDDATREEFKKESSTYKKATLLRKKIAELEGQKAGAASADKEPLKKKIAELNQQVLATEEKYQKEIADFKAGEEQRMLGYAINSSLASRQYPNEKMPHKVKVQTAYNLINDVARERGARIVFGEDKQSIKLVNADNPDLDYTVNNKVIPYETFVEQALADNGLTIVSNPAQNGNGSHHQVDVTKLDNAQKQLLEHVSQM